MDKLNSGVLIEHIEEAKDWLDKAKNEYSQSNPTRGEIILNLAQAEVKHAWELSRRETVKNNVTAKIEKKPLGNFKKGYLVPIAASILLFAAILFNVKMGKNNIATQNLATHPTVKTNPVIQEPTRNVATKEIPEQIVEKPVAPVAVAANPKPQPPIVKAPELSGSGTQPKVAPVAIAKVETVAESPELTRREQPATVVVTTRTRVQPVTQLTIDEDALTREASRSLRSGK